MAIFWGMVIHWDLNGDLLGNGVSLRFEWWFIRIQMVIHWDLNGG